MLQSHARAIRHSDPGIVTCCHHINQIVTIPRTGNPSFRRDLTSLAKGTVSRYNPTHGQSVIPTLFWQLKQGMVSWLQSHARAIRHSDSWMVSGVAPAIQVTIPRTGNASFRHLLRDPADGNIAGYNSTHGQSVIPT